MHVWGWCTPNSMVRLLNTHASLTMMVHLIHCFAVSVFVVQILITIIKLVVLFVHRTCDKSQQSRLFWAWQKVLPRTSRDDKFANTCRFLVLSLSSSKCSERRLAGSFPCRYKMFARKGHRSERSRCSQMVHTFSRGWLSSSAILLSYNAFWRAGRSSRW